MQNWLYCRFWSLAPGWCFPTISCMVQPSPGENSTVTIPDGKIITIGCRNYMPLSHNQNIVLFSKNTSAGRPLSPSLTVQCLNTQEEKYIALFPLFSVLTWMTGSRLHNRRQKEKDHRAGMEMWNTSNGILFFFFFLVVRSAQGLWPTRQEQAGCLQNGTFVTVKSYWGFFGTVTYKTAKEWLRTAIPTYSVSFPLHLR